MNACASVGTMWPTFKVPGMSASSTTCFNLYSDVVVANDPTPSVSKKSVSAPIASCSHVGWPVALWRARPYQKTQNATPTGASKTNSAAFAFIAPDSYPERGPCARYRVRARALWRQGLERAVHLGGDDAAR